jgi:peptide deformylase
MSVLEIITPINPLLRQPAREVRALTPKIQHLIDDMIETMRAAPGVGLAAPQVAVSQRVIVVEFAEPPEEPDAPPPEPELYVLINPEIMRESGERVSAVEACLSIPGFAGQVERHAAVTVKGINRQGDEVKIKAEGWLARIFQHEIDHLDGVLFIDRAEEVWRVEPEQEAEALSEGI